MFKQVAQNRTRAGTKRKQNNEVYNKRQRKETEIKVAFSNTYLQYLGQRRTCAPHWMHSCLTYVSVRHGLFPNEMWRLSGAWSHRLSSSRSVVKRLQCCWTCSTSSSGCPQSQGADESRWIQYMKILCRRRRESFSKARYHVHAERRMLWKNVG